MLLLVLLTAHMVAQPLVLDLGLRGRTERIVAAILGGLAVATALRPGLLYVIAFRG